MNQLRIKLHCAVKAAPVWGCSNVQGQTVPELWGWLQHRADDLSDLVCKMEPARVWL